MMIRKQQNRFWAELRLWPWLGELIWAPPDFLFGSKQIHSQPPQSPDFSFSPRFVWPWHQILATLLWMSNVHTAL